MIPISATIITLNEEGHIASAVASLACCDEVIVVDSHSTDRTRDIARASGARVIESDWPGYSRQKNFAALQATHDWILSVDADECVSAELAAEILKWKHEDSQYNAMNMPRRAFYLGRWINHSGWYPDRKLRLYDRRRARWEGEFVHENLSVAGPSGSFRGDLLHFPYRDRMDHERRLDRYTMLAALAARKRGRRGNILKLTLAPPAAFIKAFLIQGGILDGWRGLRIARMSARYVFIRERRIMRGEETRRG